MAVVNVVVIHGIGELRKQGSRYSLPLQQNIRKHFGVDDPDALAFYEVDWSDIGDELEADLIDNKQVIPRNLWPRPWAPLRHGLGEALDKVFGTSVEFRRFLLQGVGDVLIYLTQRGEREIQYRLIKTIL